MDAAYRKQAYMRKRSSGQRTNRDTYLALGKFARSVADKGVPPTVEQQKVIEMEAERQRRIAEGTMKQDVIASEEECLDNLSGGFNLRYTHGNRNKGC